MIEFKEYNKDNDLHFYKATETFGNEPTAIIELNKLKANKGKHIYNVYTQKNEDNYARCHKIEPFEVLQFFDREVAFEQAKKLQDKGTNVSVVLRDDGRIYMQFLTKDELFLHQPIPYRPEHSVDVCVAIKDKNHHDTIYNTAAKRWEDKQLYACANKTKPFDIIGYVQRDYAIEDGKRIQDNCYNISVVFQDDGRTYSQLLTKNELFLHQSLFSREE